MNNTSREGGREGRRGGGAEKHCNLFATKNGPNIRYRTSNALSTLRISPCLRLYTEGAWMVARHCLSPPTSATGTRYNRAFGRFPYCNVACLLNVRQIKTTGKNTGRINQYVTPALSVDYNCQYILSQCPALLIFHILHIFNPHIPPQIAGCRFYSTPTLTVYNHCIALTTVPLTLPPS